LRQRVTLEEEQAIKDLVSKYIWVIQKHITQVNLVRVRL
jgi:hypothetical protein